MKYIVNDKVVLSGPPEGPLAAYIGSFTDWVNEQGFASSSLWHECILPHVLALGLETKEFH